MTEQEIKKNIDSLETMTDAALLFYAKEYEELKSHFGETFEVKSNKKWFNYNSYATED